MAIYVIYHTSWVVICCSALNCWVVELTERVVVVLWNFMLFLELWLWVARLVEDVHQVILHLIDRRLLSLVSLFIQVAAKVEEFVILGLAPCLFDRELSVCNIRQDVQIIIVLHSVFVLKLLFVRLGVLLVPSELPFPLLLVFHVSVGVLALYGELLLLRNLPRVLFLVLNAVLESFEKGRVYVHEVWELQVEAEGREDLRRFRPHALC